MSVFVSIEVPTSVSFRYDHVIITRRSNVYCTLYSTIALIATAIANEISPTPKTERENRLLFRVTRSVNEKRQEIAAEV